MAGAKVPICRRMKNAQALHYESVPPARERHNLGAKKTGAGTLQYPFGLSLFCFGGPTGKRRIPDTVEKMGSSSSSSSPPSSGAGEIVDSAFLAGASYVAEGLLGRSAAGGREQQHHTHTTTR